MTDGNALFLHGNKIAEYASLYKNDGDDSINITLAGWDTVTTRERLNGLRGVSVYRRKGETILNGKKWNGEWVNLKEWGTGDIK